MLRRRRTPPVVHHLRGQHGIERERRHKPIEDDVIVDFLQRRKNPRKRAGKVCEDLHVVDTISTKQLSRKNIPRKGYVG